jgi:hypothetical protein
MCSALYPPLSSWHHRRYAIAGLPTAGIGRFAQIPIAEVVARRRGRLPSTWLSSQPVQMRTACSAWGSMSSRSSLDVAGDPT